METEQNQQQSPQQDNLDPCQQPTQKLVHLNVGLHSQQVFMR